MAFRLRALRRCLVPGYWEDGIGVHRGIAYLWERVAPLFGDCGKNRHGRAPIDRVQRGGWLIRENG
jgi:hypothetical protein